MDSYTVINNGSQVGFFVHSSVTRLADGSFNYLAPSGCNIGECQLIAWYKGLSSDPSNVQPTVPTPPVPTPPVLK